MLPKGRTAFSYALAATEIKGYAPKK